MSEELFYSRGEGILFFFILLMYFGAVCVGFFISRNVRNGHSTSVIGIIQTSILGLLALLLGFTFALAASRYQAHKEMVVEEANAMNAVRLRLDLLPEDKKNALLFLLKKYALSRLDYYTGDHQSSELKNVDLNSQSLQEKIWREVAEETKLSPLPSMVFLLQAVNQMIDLHGKSVLVMENHVPEIIFMLLMGVSIFALFLNGYIHGIHKYRNLFPSFMLALLLALVTIVIIDLDRPRQGMLTVGQKSLKIWEKAQNPAGEHLSN